MTLDGVTWEGPPADDADLLALLPRELASLLGQINGFILHGGALHVRGAVSSPVWHSLRLRWRGPESVASLYPSLEPDDIPFAEDCVGDQFLLRRNEVARLAAEDGSIEPTGVGLSAFLDAAAKDPTGFLLAQPLLNHVDNGGTLQPGELLFAYPPYCTAEAASGVSLKAIPADEVIRFHAGLAAKLAGVPEGGQLKIKVIDD
jgi:hypothetical protein